MFGVVLNHDYEPGSNEPSVYYDPLVLVEMKQRLYEFAPEDETINFPRILELFVEPISEEELVER